MASQTLILGEACRQIGGPANITTTATAGPNTATVYTGATNAQSFSDPTPPNPNANSLSASATIGATYTSINGSVHAGAFCPGGDSSCGVPNFGTSSAISGQIWNVITFLPPNVVASVMISQSIDPQGGAAFGLDPNNYDAAGEIVFNNSQAPFGFTNGTLYPGTPPNNQLLTPVNANQLIFNITANASAATAIGSNHIDQPVDSADAAISAGIVFESFLDSMGNAVSNFMYSSDQDLGLPGGTWVSPNPGVFCESETAIDWSLAHGDAFTAMQIDVPNHHLYVPVSGPAGKIRILDLDNNLTTAGEISDVNAHGVAVSSKSSHGFSASNPVVVWDASSLRMLRTIPLGSGIAPGAIILDPVNDLVYLFDRKSPTAIVLNASDGSSAGQFALSGTAKEAVTDGKGNIYAGIQGTDGYVVDILGLSVNGALGVANQWNLGGNMCSGLAMDGANQILFATCKAQTSQKPAAAFLMAFQAGQAIPNAGIPILSEGKSAVFNPIAQELFSLQTDGTLMILKENSTSSFAVEQYVRATSMPARPTSLALDSRTGDVYYGGKQMQSEDAAKLTLYLLGK